MKAPALLLVALLLTVSRAEAQRENDIWYFGNGAGIDFNGPLPRPLTDGVLDAVEGCASIADPATGALLFYTDGITVWNRLHRPMPNGTGLGGGPSSVQAAGEQQAEGKARGHFIARPAPVSAFY